MEKVHSGLVYNTNAIKVETQQVLVIFDGKSLFDISESEFDEEYRWKKISMIFQGAMNSLDPVFTINEQFREVLKQHNFEGDENKIIADAMRSVSLDEMVLKKYPHELIWWNETTCYNCNGVTVKTKICYCR